MFLQRSARLPMGRTSSSVLRSFLYLIGLAEDLLLKAGWSPAAIFDLAIVHLLIVAQRSGFSELEASKKSPSSNLFVG